MTSNTSTARSSNPVQDAVRSGVRDLSAVWWWFLGLGVAWTLFGTYVLSYRVGSLAAVAALAGVAFLFGGFTQLVVASRVQSWRWLYVVAGILGVAAGILTLAWPAPTLYVLAVLTAWYLIIFGIIHLISALAGPKLSYWWTQLLLGVAELALGVWAVRSFERSLVTLVTLVGVWAIFHGVNQIFAAFTLRHTANKAKRLVG
jgi:uncharacterized membrane protein HdeD (DUF308 family)